MDPLSFESAPRRCVLALAVLVIAAAGAACDAAPAWEPSDAAPCADLRAVQADDAAGVHTPLDVLLRAHVRRGAVRYDCLERDAALLDGYLDTLGGAAVERLAPEERLALWINAYNAFTLKLILEHFPDIESIKDIPSGERWKAVRWDVGGTLYSLDGIEHEILRPEFEEPRIHFAIVCAAKSCPDLRAEAFVGSRLDEQLDDAARTFLQDPAKGARTELVKSWLFGKTPVLHVSRILSWFGSDFTRGGRSVADFVEPFLTDEDRAFVARHRDELKVKHLDYDWTLNGR